MEKGQQGGDGFRLQQVFSADGDNGQPHSMKRADTYKRSYLSAHFAGADTAS